MTVEELAEKLEKMYNQACRSEATCQVHLFGIIYASQLQSCGRPIFQIAQCAGLRPGYAAEISKGI